MKQDDHPVHRGHTGAQAMGDPRIDTSQQPSLLVDVKQAAALLSISPRLLWDLTDSGEIRPIRANSRVLYARTELQRWIDAQLCKPRKEI
jgi:hypothetical protein